jgi:hypothetical protein
VARRTAAPKEETMTGKRHSMARLLAGSLVAAACVVVATGAGLEAQSRSKKFLGGPLTIEDQGSFFIGGVQKVTPYAAPAPPAKPGAPATPPVPQQITIGQMYVQFQIPAKKYGAQWPVIMVHGSTHTGACLEATPDGREGWYPYFVRHGVPSYVVDQAGRGRSGFDASVLHEAEARLTAGDSTAAADLIPGFGRITDNGAWTAWFGHLVPEGSTVLTGKLVPHGSAEDPNPKPDAYAHVAPLFPIEATDAKLVSRTGAIGPAVAGTPNYYALEYYKQLVPNAEVTLPGSRCESCDPKEIAPANTWTPMNLAALVERLGGAIVVTHSQSGIMGHHMTRILKEHGKLDLLKGLITLEGSCSLGNSGLTASDFDNIPYMALKGDYTATSNVCQETVDAINKRRATKQGTAKAEYLKLDDMGILGVTHMMMLDKKNLEIADIMLNWVNKNVRAAR